MVTWHHDLQSVNRNYRAWAPYFIDWSAFVTTLEHGPAYKVTDIHSLAVIALAPH